MARTPVTIGGGKWYEDPQILGRRLFFVLALMMVALAQRDNIYWFFSKLFASDPNSKGTGITTWLRLVAHSGFFLKFLSTRTQAGLNKWTMLWCMGILIILTSQHALSFPASVVVLAAALAFKVCSHEISSVLKLSFAKKLGPKFKWVVILTVVALAASIFFTEASTGIGSELKIYLSNLSAIGRLGRDGWPIDENATPMHVAAPEETKPPPSTQKPVADLPVVDSKLRQVKEGAQMLHVLLVGLPQDDEVRQVAESLQSDGKYAVTIASGYKEVVSSISEYSFNAVVLPRGEYSSAQLELGRVVLALKMRYHGELQPVREGELVSTISMLAPRWPGGTDSWRILQMLPV